MNKFALSFYSLDDEDSFSSHSLIVKKKRLKICIESFKKNFLNFNEIDIFFHGWDNELSKYAIKILKPKKYLLESKHLKKNYLKKYSLKYINLYDDVSDLKIRKIDPLKDYNDFINVVHNRFLSQTKSLNLLFKYSKNKNKNYQNIISCRYDIILKKKLNLPKINLNKILTVKNPYISNDQIYDIFLYGNKNLFKINEYFKKINDYPVGPTRGLYVFFREKKIKVDEIFDYKDILPSEVYFKYIRINIYNKIINKLAFAIIHLLNFIQLNSRKLKFFLYSLIN